MELARKSAQVCLIVQVYHGESINTYAIRVKLVVYANHAQVILNAFLTFPVRIMYVVAQTKVIVVHGRKLAVPADNMATIQYAGRTKSVDNPLKISIHAMNAMKTRTATGALMGRASAITLLAYVKIPVYLILRSNHKAAISGHLNLSAHVSLDTILRTPGLVEMGTQSVVYAL